MKDLNLIAPLVGGTPNGLQVRFYEDAYDVIMDDGTIVKITGEDLVRGECDTCGYFWPEDRFNRECSSPATCFRCRVAGLGVGFQGGKEFWHNDTVKGSVNRIQREFAAANGGEMPIPKTKSATGGFATVSQETKLRKALTRAS